MANLLHIDSSIRHDGSISREVSAAFAAEWRLANPDGGYVYRDLAVNPVPHADEAYNSARTLPEPQRTETDPTWAVTQQLHDEVLAADTILIGSPMYNFSIPSTLKAWLDRIITPSFMVDQETGNGPLVGKLVVVVTARGGSYSPGAPREDFDFQEPYLRAAFSLIGLDRNLEFVHTEFTLADVVPQMAAFREHAVASREQAHNTVRKLAAA